jgi:hypothetical protein
MDREQLKKVETVVERKRAEADAASRENPPARPPKDERPGQGPPQEQDPRTTNPGGKKTADKWNQ